MQFIQLKISDKSNKSSEASLKIKEDQKSREEPCLKGGKSRKDTGKTITQAYTYKIDFIQHE